MTEMAVSVNVRLRNKIHFIHYVLTLLFGLLLKSRLENSSNNTSHFLQFLTQFHNQFE